MTQQTEALTKLEPKPLQPVEFSAFGSASQFSDAQRIGKLLCSSTIVPETYRGETNLGNCVIALEIANRIGAGVLAVMQNLYIVYGRPAWSSQFLISCVNASRKFTPLRYKMTGEKNTDTWGCIAWAQDQTGERLESPEITIATAKAEGWFQKNGSKWKTMPELMLRYRTATLFARLYAPELTMGIQTDDEVIDIDVVQTSPVVTDPKTPVFDGPPMRPVVATVPPPLPPGQVVAATKPRGRPAKVAEPSSPPVQPKEPELPPTAGEGDPFAVEPEAPPAVSSAPVQQSQPVAPAPAAAPVNPQPAADPAAELREAMALADVTEAQVLSFCVKKKLGRADGQPATTLGELKPKTIELLVKNLGIADGPVTTGIRAEPA